METCFWFDGCENFGKSKERCVCNEEKNVRPGEKGTFPYALQTPSDGVPRRLVHTLRFRLGAPSASLFFSTHAYTTIPRRTPPFFSWHHRTRHHRVTITRYQGKSIRVESARHATSSVRLTVFPRVYFRPLSPSLRSQLHLCFTFPRTLSCVRPKQQYASDLPRRCRRYSFVTCELTETFFDNDLTIWFRLEHSKNQLSKASFPKLRSFYVEIFRDAAKSWTNTCL